MRAKIMAALVLASLLLLFSAVAFADRPVTQDVVWRFSQVGSSDNVGLYAYGSGAGCTPTRAAYLQWDLSDLAYETTVDYAAVRLKIAAATGIQAGTRLGIYPLSDTWTEATANQDLPAPPTLDAALLTIAAPVDPQVVTFIAESADSPLSAYITEQLKTGGDRKVSVAVMFASSCDANSDSTYNLEDQENSLGTGVGPDLLVSGGATVVDIRTFRSASLQAAWPLYSALVVLAALLVAGVAVSRRRAV